MTKAEVSKLLEQWATVHSKIYQTGRKKYEGYAETYLYISYLSTDCFKVNLKRTKAKLLKLLSIH